MGRQQTPTPVPSSQGWFSQVAADNEDEVAERLTDALWDIVSRLRAGNLSTSRVGRSTVLG